jgi:hypothetical protein
MTAGLGAGRRSDRAVVSIFMHLAGDFETLTPIALRALSHPRLEPVVVVHPALIDEVARAPAFLSGANLQWLIVEADGTSRDWLAAAPDARAWLFGCESTRKPHLRAHRLALEARAAGLATFTVQQGFENVGLNYFDAVAGPHVSFASEHVLIWGDPGRLPPELSAETRSKVLAVGRPVWPDDPGEPPPAPIVGRSFDVAVFENLHWRRYSNEFRDRFIESLEWLCMRSPRLEVILRPHPQGRWSTTSGMDRMPVLENLTIADPAAEAWGGASARQIIDCADLVVTTPSTVALDAALKGAPCAVFAYDLDLPLYSGLPLVRDNNDVQALIEHPRAPALLEASERFARTATVSFEGDTGVLSAIEMLIAQ